MNDDDLEFQDIALTAGDAVNAAALVPEVPAHLGGEDQPTGPELPADVRGARVRLRLGRRPIALDLAAVYAAAGRPLPPEYAVASPHRLCLVMLPVAVMNEGSSERVRKIGLRVRLPDDPRVRIFDLFPRPELVTRLEAGLECNADVHIDGQVEAAGDSPLGALTVGLPFGVNVRAAAGAGGRLVGRVAFAVYSRVVDAVGVGDSQAHWVLTRQDRPLDGRTHLFGLVVSVRKASRALALKANVYTVIANLTTLYTWPIRLEQPDWTDLPVLVQQKLTA